MFGELGTVKIHEVDTRLFPRVSEHVIFSEMYFFNHEQVLNLIIIPKGYFQLGNYEHFKVARPYILLYLLKGQYNHVSFIVYEV